MERTQYNALKRRLSVQTELELAAGDGVEQVSGVLLLRVVEDLVGGGMLHELAVLHHHNLVGDLTNHGQIVGDEQVAQLRPFSACRSLSRRNTWSCTSTSKADTASSHTMTSGSRAMARAMAIR